MPDTLHIFVLRNDVYLKHSQQFSNHQVQASIANNIDSNTNTCWAKHLIILSSHILWMHIWVRQREQDAAKAVSIVSSEHYNIVTRHKELKTNTLSAN